MRTLLIKMSSMGDLIQTLPALTDAKKAIPDISFDWVAEGAFTDIPRLHPAVSQVFPINLRAWRKQLWHSLKQGEPQTFLKQLRQARYDHVIDAQGSLKSAVVCRLAKGLRSGFTKADVREWGAHLCYQRHYPVPMETHALTRSRELMALSLGYPVPTSTPDYGIDRTKLVLPNLALPEQYLMAVTNASWESKIWPENYWQTLLAQLAEHYQLPIFIPCGNSQEQAFAEQVAGKHAKVLPRLTLTELAALIANAKGMITGDTGLAHLAAALNTKTIVLYGSTNANRIGTVGPTQHHLIATEPACAPCHKRICDYKGQSPEQPACLASLTPTKVFDAMQGLLVSE